MAIVEAINIPIGVTGQETVQQAANSYEDLGDAVAKTQREAERLALQYGVNDAKTQEAIVSAAKYKRQLDQLDTSINLNTSSMELLLSITQSLVGGFTAAIGATAIFGAESEDLQRLLVKVQGALAFSEGLNTLREQLPTAVTGLTSKFKTFNITVNTTNKLLKGLGVGALLVGIGLLIKYMDTVVAKFKEWGDALGITNFALKEQVKSQQQIVDETERQIALNEALGKSEEEILKQKIELAKESEKLAQLQLEYAQFQKEGVEEATQATLDAANNTKIAEANLTAFYKLTLKERLEAQLEFRQNMFALEFQDYLDGKKLLEQIEELERQYLLDKYDPNGDYVRIRKAGRIFANKEAEEQAQIEYLNLQEQKRKELELLEEAYLKDLISKESYEKKKAELDGYYKDLEFKRTQNLKQKERDTQEEFAVGTAQMLLDLNNIFQGQKEDQSRQEFEREKALQIGQTLIGTYFAAQRAYASQINPLDPTSPIRAGLAAAFATASGLARVATIRRVRYNDPNAPTGASNKAGGISQTVPRFNAPTTRLPQTDEFTQVRRVYVTERDITNVQDKVRVTESLSQF
jgi:hypothetical protein